MLWDVNCCDGYDDEIADLNFIRSVALQNSEDDEILEEQILPHILTNFLKRNSSLFRKRWDSDYLRSLAVNEGSFLAEYRVDPGGFDILHDILENSIQRNDRYSAIAMGTAGSAAITTASRLGAALIMLGGGRRIEAMRTHGISMSTTYDNFDRVIKAINSHPALSIDCDMTPDGMRARADGFKDRSTHGLFQYCTGAIDGLAIHIRAPSRLEVMNQSRFFSGNKKKYCMNMQGVCDANCRFIAVTCKHVGSTNDAVAYNQGSLKELCESHQYPYHWNGDNAYTLSECMMIPFPGSNLSVTNPSREWFNFWHSQVRITIERAFGIFVQRFGIFWQALKYDLNKSMEIVHACCRLHNFCINRNLPVISSHHVPLDVAAVNVGGTLIDNTWRTNVTPTDSWGTVNTGSTLRDEIVDVVGRNNYAHDRNYR